MSQASVGIRGRDISAAYMWLYLGNDGAGNPQDISGNDLDAAVGANVSNAWANAGYFSSEAGADSTYGLYTPFASIPKWDLRTESLLFAFTLKGSAPAANEDCMGMGGGGSTDPGIRLLVTTAGKMQVTINRGAQVGATATTATVADGSDHRVIVGIDGPSQLSYAWVGGAVDLNGYNHSAAGDGPGYPTRADTVGWGYGGNGSFGGDDFVVFQFKAVHALKFTGSLPSRLSNIVALLNACPYEPLSVHEVGV